MKFKFLPWNKMHGHTSHICHCYWCFLGVGQTYTYSIAWKRACAWGASCEDLDTCFSCMFLVSKCIFSDVTATAFLFLTASVLLFAAACMVVHQLQLHHHELHHLHRLRHLQLRRVPTYFFILDALVLPCLFGFTSFIGGWACWVHPAVEEIIASNIRLCEENTLSMSIM